MDIVGEILQALYYILPAYCANASPVLFGGGQPIDLGKKFFDGKPIFGPHKTYYGFISGLIIGTLIGWVQENLAPMAGLPRGGTFLGFILSLGALTGDLMGSFIKRRLNIKPGEMLPVVDQLDFVLFALLLASIIDPTPISPLRAAMIIALTGPIHISVNAIAYMLGLKDNPW